MSKGLTRVDPGQHKITMVIILVLKLNFMVNSGQGLGHRLEGSTRVDLS
jgi:hypothetical protein